MTMFVSLIPKNWPSSGADWLARAGNLNSYFGGKGQFTSKPADETGVAETSLVVRTDMEHLDESPPLHRVHFHEEQVKFQRTPRGRLPGSVDERADQRHGTDHQSRDCQLNLEGLDSNRVD